MSSRRRKKKAAPAAPSSARAQESGEPQERAASGDATQAEARAPAGKNAGTNAGKKKGRRWRFIGRGLFAVALILVALRIALPSIVASAASSWARGQGLELTFEEIDFGLLSGRVVVWGANLAKDGDRQIRIETLELDLDMSALLRGDLAIRRAEIDGVDARLERNSDGALTLFSDAPPAEPQEEDDEPSAGSGPLESLELPIAVHAARVQRVSLAWTDAAVQPPIQLDAELDLAISDLGVADRTAHAELRFSAPGAIEHIALDAKLDARATTLDADVRLDIDGIDGSAARAYLVALGLEPPDRAQDLRIEAVADVELEGPNALRGSIAITQSVGRGSGAPRAGDRRASDTWLELASVRAVLEPDARGTRIDLFVEGLALEAERAADGRFEIAGFAFGGDPAPAPDESAAAAANPDGSSASESADAAANDVASDTDSDADASDPAPAAIRLATINVHEASVALVDRAVRAEPLRNVLRLEAVDVDLEPEGGGIDARGTLAAPDIFSSLVVEAAFDAGGGRASVAFDGLTLAGAAPYLAAADLEPTGRSSSLSLAVAVEQVDGGTTARVTELALVDGPRTPLEVTSAVYRDADGVLSAELTGLVLRAISEAPGVTAFGPLRIGRTAAAALDASETESAAQDANGGPSGPNAGGPRAIDVEVRLDGRVEELDLAANGGARAGAPVSATLLAPGLVDHVRLDGTLQVFDGGFDANAALEIVGLRERALADLRPNFDEMARGGSALLAARVEPSGDGGERLTATVRELDLDGLLALDELTFEGSRRPLDANDRDRGDALEGHLGASGLTLPQLELSGGELDLDLALETAPGRRGVRVDELTFGDGTTSVRAASIVFVVRPREDGGRTIETAALRGVEVDARRRADGALIVAGLMLVPPRAEAADAPANGGAANGTPLNGDAANAPAPEPIADRSDRESLAIESLDIELTRVEVVDAATGESTRARLTLVNSEPSVVFDPSGESTPLELHLDGAVEPGVGSFAMQLSAESDEGGIGFTGQLSAAGLSDAGWIAAWPDLADTLAVGGVVDGRFDAALQARIDAPRTSALGLELRRLNDASLELRDVSFVPRADTDEGLALGLARAQVGSFGTDGTPLRLSDLEISDVSVSIVHEAGRTAYAGVRVKSEPPPAESDAAAPAPAPSPPPSSETEGSAAAAPEEQGGGVVIDRLVWNGLDLVYDDLTVEPTTHLPIAALDLDARNVAIGAPLRRPLTFRASMRGAPVELKDLPRDGNFLTNLAREVVGGAERTRSERRWVDEVVVSGNLRSGPALEGWIRAEVYSFELTALEGLAQGGGVEVGAGTADTNVRIDFRGRDGQRIKSRTTFTSLSVSEPAGGPISRFLRLPAPLDVVLWVLRNERGEHVIPLDFTLDDEGLNTAELVAQGTQALIQLITEALASSPLRLGGSLLDFVGLDPFGRDPKEVEQVVVEVRYEPGDTRLDPAGQAALTEVLRALGEDDNAAFRVVHLFSAQDVERARELAIPDPEASRQLSSRIEIERGETIGRLAFARERLARLVATGSKEEAAELAQALRNEAARLDGLERALNTLYALSVPADDRTQAKRLRAAALRLAERRFEAIVRELFERGVGDAIGRLQFVRPSVGALVEEEGAPGRLVFTPRGR